MRTPTRPRQLEWADAETMHWEDLPADVRARVCDLLGRLLRRIAAAAPRPPMSRSEKIRPEHLARPAFVYVRQEVGRSGAGEIPLVLSTLATVLRATPCPRFFSAPWIRV
jgi:hypothetical protein